MSSALRTCFKTSSCLHKYCCCASSGQPERTCLTLPRYWWRFLRVLSVVLPINSSLTLVLDSCRIISLITQVVYFGAGFHFVFQLEILMLGYMFRPPVCGTQCSLPHVSFYYWSCSVHTRQLQRVPSCKILRGSAQSREVVKSPMPNKSIYQRKRKLDYQ